ncbi:spore coat protein U domain-containing protein [Achromobacter sp. UMC71]|uniref:Csu type fimbrial protein n=1 Tax=Achromobacter sp. UMC71 TaxID=1862320 RepID=UPI0015FFBAA5|nr:spore coat protein U [Achromobacter sp. UMC71]
MKRLSLCATTLALVTAGAMPLAAQAQTTANMVVTLTITANCTIAANPLNFGSHGVLNTAFSNTTTVNVTCTNTTPYTVGLSAGTGTGSTLANRLMNGTTTGNTTSTVAYQLYQPAPNQTVVWGDTGVADRVGGTGSGAAQALTVTGTVPAQATPTPDLYTSTVTATVYF